jgi:MFS family permease
MNFPATEPRPTRVRYLVLGVLCSLAFLTYFDRICIMQVQDDISRDLNFGQLTSRDEEKLRAEDKQDDPEARAQAEKARATARMSWVFWAFILGYGIFEVPGGWMGDRWGPRAVLVRIVIWWSIFTAMTGSADVMVRWLTSSPEPWMFLGAMVLVRFVFGLGEAGAYPNIGRAIARWFPFRDRAAATSFIWMSSRIGGAVSPWIIGAMSDSLGGWRPAFWVLGAVGIVWAFAFYGWFRDRPEEMPGANQAEAALIRADSGPGSIHHDDGHTKVPWSRLLFSTNLWALYIVASSASFSWYFNVTYLPKYLLEVFNVEFKDSRWFTGSPLLAGAITCVAGGWISDNLIRRTGSKRWGRSLVGVVGFGMAGLFTLTIPTFHSHWPVIAVLCIVSAFQDLAVPIIWTVSADIGERYAGTVAGAMNCMGGVGASLGILLAPRIAAYFDDWNFVFIVNGWVYLAGALAWLRVNAAERLVNREGPSKW